MTTIQIDRDHMADAVTFAARALPKSSSTPTMLGIRLVAKAKTLTASAFDYETYAAANVKIGAGTFDILVPGQTLVRYVTALPAGEVSVELDGSILRLSSGKAKVALHTMDGSNYPSAPKMPADLGAVGAKSYQSAIASVRQCVDPNHALHIMRGIFLHADAKSLLVIGTDARHIAESTIEWKGKSHDRIAVPLVLADAAKSFDAAITLALDDNLLGMHDGNRAIIGRLIAGDHPKLDGLFDRAKPTLHVTVDRVQLIEGLKFAALGTQSKDTRSAEIAITDSSLTVSMSGADTYDAISAMDAEVQGDPFDVKVDPTYLLHVLDVTEAERVILHMQNDRLPITVNGADDDRARALVAPKSK